MHPFQKGSSTLEAAIIFPVIMSLIIFVIFFAFHLFEKAELVCNVNMMLVEDPPLAENIRRSYFQKSLSTQYKTENYFFFKKYKLNIKYVSSIPYYKGGLKILDIYEQKYVDPETFIRNVDFVIESAFDIKELIIP